MANTVYRISIENDFDPAKEDSKIAPVGAGHITGGVKFRGIDTIHIELFSKKPFVVVIATVSKTDSFKPTIEVLYADEIDETHRGYKYAVTMIEGMEMTSKSDMNYTPNLLMTVAKEKERESAGFVSPFNPRMKPSMN